MDSLTQIPEVAWDRNSDNLFAEGVVAAYLHRSDDDTRWLGGNTPLIDVRGADKRVDAKVAFRKAVAWRDGTVIEALGFMGSARAVQAREGVSHYALVELDMPGTFTNVGSTFSYSAIGTARLFLVPAAVVNARFFPAWRKDGLPGSGLNLYIPALEVAAYEVDL